LKPSSCAARLLVAQSDNALSNAWNTCDVRAISLAEVRRPLDPIAEVAPVVRARLEALGIAFVEDDDPGLPGPSQTAALELTSGAQFAFEHFYAHPASFIAVRAERGASPAGTPRGARDAPSDVLTLHGSGVARIPARACAWVLVTGPRNEAIVPVVIPFRGSFAQSDTAVLPSRVWNGVPLAAFEACPSRLGSDRVRRMRSAVRAASTLATTTWPGATRQRVWSPTALGGTVGASLAVHGFRLPPRHRPTGIQPTNCEPCWPVSFAAAWYAPRLPSRGPADAKLPLLALSASTKSGRSES